MELTKEQKLEIVSKAIDAGAKVEVNFYQESNTSVDDLIDNSLIFQGMKMEKWTSVKDTLDWLEFSDEKFEGTLFFHKDLSKPTPKEWQDTGDMEEANV